MKHKNLKKTVLIVGGGVFIGLATLSIVEVASSGASLAYLENQEASLRAENQNLNDKLVGASSLSLLEDSAQDLGFIKPEKTLYISEKDAVAKLP